MKLLSTIMGFVMALCMQACSESSVEHIEGGIEIVEELARSQAGFTQGLFITDGKLYESTGLYGKSSIRRFDLESGELEVSKPLPKHLFAEGFTAQGTDKAVQLTWQEHIGIVYERASLNILKVFEYPMEGWGITNQGEALVMSDGSSSLYFLNPKTYQVEKKMEVTYQGSPLKKLNELEWVGDYIYANIWMSDQIAKINAQSGVVEMLYDCRSLYQPRPRDSDAVLNGIAYCPEEQLFYLTGKTWKKVYKVRFIDPVQKGE